MSTQFDTGQTTKQYWDEIAAGPAQLPILDASWVSGRAAYEANNQALAAGLSNPVSISPSVANVTATSGNGTNVTVTANNAFKAGQIVRFAGVTGDFGALNNEALAVLATGLSGTQFEVASSVGPITLAVTAVSGSGTVITLTANNTLVGGETVTFSGFTGAWTGLNSGSYTVASATTTHITIAGATTGSTSTGTAHVVGASSSTGTATTSGESAPLPPVGIDAADNQDDLFDYSPERYVL